MSSFYLAKPYENVKPRKKGGKMKPGDKKMSNNIDELAEVEFKKALRNFLDYIDNLENRVTYARIHILRNIEKFTPEELECMTIDGVIRFEDIPEGKRTKWVEKRIKERKKIEEVKEK